MSDDERDWLDELDDPTDRLQEPEGAPDPICTGCNRKPAEIQEYIDLARDLGTDPDSACRMEEGTFNHSNGHFLCSSCYIAAGMPSSPHGWKAP